MRVLTLGLIVAVAAVCVAPAHADVLTFTGTASYDYSITDHAVLFGGYVDDVYYPEEVLLDDYSSGSGFNPGATLEFQTDLLSGGANGTSTSDALGTYVHWDLVFHTFLLDNYEFPSDPYFAGWFAIGNSTTSSLFSGLQSFALDMGWYGSTHEDNSGGSYGSLEHWTLDFTGGGIADSLGTNTFVFDLMYRYVGYTGGPWPSRDGDRFFEQYRTVTESYHMEMTLQDAPIPPRPIVPEPATALLVAMGLLLPFGRRLVRKARA